MQRPNKIFLYTLYYLFHNSMCLEVVTIILPILQLSKWEIYKWLVYFHTLHIQASLLLRDELRDKENTAPGIFLKYFKSHKMLHLIMFHSNKKPQIKVLITHAGNS